MERARFTIVNATDGKVLYDIQLNGPVTVLHDESGTGKTALAQILRGEERDSVIIRSNLPVYSTTDEIKTRSADGRIIAVLDEDAPSDLTNSAIQAVQCSMGFLLIVGRDLSKLHIQDKISFARLKCDMSNVIHLEYCVNNEVCTAPAQFRINNVMCEDSGSGRSFYRTILPASIPINDNLRGTMGYSALLKRLKDNGISNGTLIILDGATFPSISHQLMPLVRVFNTNAYIYAFSCFEELLLNLDVFDAVSQVQSYLKSGRVPTGYKGTAENYAYDLLSSTPVSPRFVHNKSGDNIDCRIFTKVNRSRIASLLPSVLQGYLLILNPSTNKYVVRSILWNIVNNPKYAVFKDGKYQQEIRAYLRTNTTIVTVDELVSDVIARRVTKYRDGKSYFYNIKSCLLVCKGQVGKDNFVKCNAEVMDLLSLIKIQYSV